MKLGLAGHRPVIDVGLALHVEAAGHLERELHPLVGGDRIDVGETDHLARLDGQPQRFALHRLLRDLGTRGRGLLGDRHAEILDERAELTGS